MAGQWFIDGKCVCQGRGQVPSSISSLMYRIVPLPGIVSLRYGSRRQGLASCLAPAEAVTEPHGWTLWVHLWDKQPALEPGSLVFWPPDSLLHPNWRLVPCKEFLCDVFFSVP